ncbi:MAG: TolC family protein [Gammaproteobacteria bacterium]|nr:TolC family protein [Gammaproteobacteria bacterium]
MKYIFTALLIVVNTWSLSTQAASDVTTTPHNITLADAIRATLQHNPELIGYKFRSKVIDGERQTARLRPAWRIGAEIENAYGSDAYADTDNAELTFSLASLIELGGQRDARINVVNARQQQLASQQRAATLKVLGDVTQHFIMLVAAQEKLALELEAESLAQQTVIALNMQVQAGRSANAELSRARAALAHAGLQIQKARQSVNQQRLQLSLYWADAAPGFKNAEANLFSLPPPLSLAELQNNLASNPDAELLEREVTLRQAQRRQAETTTAGIEWNAGYRRFEANEETAYVFGLSVPLGLGRRNAGAIATATAEEESALLYQRTAQMQLEAQLLASYEIYTLASAEAESLQTHIVPLLQTATRTTFDAFRQGRYSYLELNQAQRELLYAKSALIDAAVRVHQARIEIERMTGSLPNDANEATSTKFFREVTP